jgi:hypothetical protein
MKKLKTDKSALLMHHAGKVGFTQSLKICLQHLLPRDRGLISLCPEPDKSVAK